MDIEEDIYSISSNLQHHWLKDAPFFCTSEKKCCHLNHDSISAKTYPDFKDVHVKKCLLEPVKCSNLKEKEIIFNL